MPLKYQTELQMTGGYLTQRNANHTDQQFRLIGVGVYALSTQEPLPQLSLWSTECSISHFLTKRTKIMQFSIQNCVFRVI